MLKKICRMVAWPAPNGSLSGALNCWAFILMATYLLVLPIAHTIAVRHIAFYSLLLLTLWAVWRYRLRLSFPVAWAWAVYAAIALCSVLYAIDPAYSLSEVKREVVYGFLALVLAATWIRSAEALSRMIAVIIAGNLLMVGYAVFSIVVSGLGQSYLQEGSFSGVGMFSTYLITVFPFVAAYALQLKDTHKTIYYLLLAVLALNGIVLYFSGNRAGLVSLLVELVVAAYLLRDSIFPRAQRRFLITIIVLAVVLTGLFVKQMNERVVLRQAELGVTAADEPDQRWKIWRVAVENIRAHPLVGAGFGREAFRLRNPEFSKEGTNYWHAHNVFLNKGVQMGIPGMLAFLVLMLAALRAVWIACARRETPSPLHAYATACMVMMVGLLTKNMTDDFFVRDGALLFWVLTGAVLGALGGERAAHAL
jgi:O-antigen ligase